MPIEDYDHFRHASDGLSRRIYFRHPENGPGPPVILMHELGGMDPPCVERGDDLRREGFSVYLPLFFGAPGRRSSPLRWPLFCLRRELDCFAIGRTSPIADWLRSLCRSVSERHDGAGLGIIGMCLTGNFALYAVLEACVQAPVLCQPSLPIGIPTRRRRADLKLSPEHLHAIKERVASESLPIVGVRFANDRISPDDKFQTLEKEFGANFRPTRIPCEGHAHATLTEHFWRQGAPEAFADIVAFLKERLVRR